MTPIGPGGGVAASSSHHGGGAPARRLWWIPAIRGAIAIMLGVLVTATGSHRAALVNFLGIYWLFSAVLIIAWALRTRWKRGSRLGLLAGMVGLVAGLLVLGRHVLEPVVSARFLLDALGVPAVLTGTLRLLGAFEVERRTGRWWTVGGLALGSVEIALGAIVLVAGSGNLRLVTVAIAAWGLIGGTLLLLEGFKIRRSLRALQVPCLARCCDKDRAPAVRPRAELPRPGIRFYATRIGPEHRNRGHIRHLEALGYKVTLEPAA